MAIRVLLADDHHLIRQSLQQSLQGSAGIEIVGEASTGWEALKLVEELRPDIVIMDLGMPDLNGIDATSRIMADYPSVRVIALSAHPERRYVSAMFNVGAYGYVLKENTLTDLVDAVRAVSRGKKYVSPEIAEFVITGSGQIDAEEFEARDQLGERERHVLQLLAEGHTSKEIARQLKISAATVDTHRRNIMRKLNIHSVAELTRYAIREGLTEL